MSATTRTILILLAAVTSYAFTSPSSHQKYQHGGNVMLLLLQQQLPLQQQQQRRRMTGVVIGLAAASPLNDDDDDIDDIEDDDDDDIDNDDEPIIMEEAASAAVQTSTIRIDDGGSDLTDRFKYKVNALMGVFDPQQGADDTERQDGNILNAMLKFPARFAFTVVGRTGGDEERAESFVEQVKTIACSLSGDGDYQCQITPRGKSFTRVSIQVKVDSAAVIKTIYEELGNMEMTVMKY